MVMRTTTFLRTMLVTVVCLFAGMTVQAQNFSATLEMQAAKGYDTKPVTFSLVEVAAALGIDNVTLAGALDSWTAEGSTDANMFFLVQATGPTDNYTQGSKGGFWVNVEGAPQEWSSDNSLMRWYNTIGWDLESDVFQINIGQYPEQCQPDDVYTPNFMLTFNGKEVYFSVTIKITAAPVYDIPEPTTVEKDLTIVGEQNIVVEQYPRSGYDSDAVYVKLGNALSLLGITDPALVVNNLAELLYTTQYNSGSVEEGGGMKMETLTNGSTATAPGWWLRPVQNESGEETGEVSAAGWSGDDKFFVESFSYNAEGDTLTCKLGQYPGSCKDNEQWFANVYMIYGEKAYRIKYTLKLMERETGNGLADYTKVGEETVVVEEEPRDDYSYNSIHPDVEAIAAALECEVSALGLVALDDKDNFAASTANQGGWWFTDAGTVVAWANGSLYVEPATTNDFTTLNVGQHATRNYAIGDEAEARLYFVNGTKYYAYTVQLKIVEPQQVEHNFEIVATRSFNVQAIPANDYPIGDLITISAESLEEAIGTVAPTLYGEVNDSVAAVTGSKYSTKYSCDPKPGFWLDKEGYVSTWGGSSPVGICWVDNSVLRFFQYPNANGVGDVFTTHLYLVNETTSKMIALNISLSFVESIQEKEIVGEETVAIPVTTDNKDVEINAAKAAELLGITVDDLFNDDNYYWRGLTSGGVYGEGQSASGGMSFGLDGGFDLYGDIYVYPTNNGDNVVLSVFSNTEVAEDFSANAQICIEVGDKQYVIYANLLSEALYAGITTVKSDSRKAGKVYDLSGREVKQPARGLYIKDGKKVVF